MTKVNYWLMKSEPDAYSIDSLKRMELLYGMASEITSTKFHEKMAIGDKVFFTIQTVSPQE